MKNAKIVGRNEELVEFDSLLSRAASGTGGTLLISGEAGIGKTHLVTECRRRAAERGVRILPGWGTPGSLEPFQMFSDMFSSNADNPHVLQRARISFSAVFLINSSGLLIAEASNETQTVDTDIVAGMMSAVKNFVKDSLASSGDRDANLDKLEFGELKIIIEHGRDFFITAVLKGSETGEIRAALKSAFERIKEEHGGMLAAWKGDMSAVEPVREIISSLAGMKFMVKQELSGGMLENERNRVSDAVLDAVCALSAESPILMVLEDLHWADDSSLFILNYLARNIAGQRVMILGTMRPGESDVLSAQLGKMRAEGIVEEMPLEALGTDAVRSLVDEICPGNDFQDGFIRTLFENCAGNPFFITELVRQMVADGQIAENGGKHVLLGEAQTLPAAIGDFVGRKLETLPPDVIVLLEYASCIGVRFDEVILREYGMANGLDSAFEPLYGSGMVVNSEGTVEFTHAIFQDAIYQDIGSRWRAAHHKSLGEHYERAYSDRQTDALYLLARHFSRSNEHAKAYDYCMRAGEKAEADFAPAQALELYKLALDAIGKIRPAPEASAAPALMEKVGDLKVIVGDLDGALAFFTAAGEKTERKESTARLFRKCGTTLEEKGDFDRALESLARAKELLGDERTVEYGKICQAEGSILGKKGDNPRAMALLESALSIYEKNGGNQRDIGTVLRVIGLRYMRTGDLDTALGYYEESLKIMESIGNVQGISFALNNIGVLNQERGELDLALEYHKRSLDAKQKAGDMSGMTSSLGNIGNTYYAKGEFDEALDYHTKALAMKERFGQHWGVASSLLTMGAIHVARGELDTAQELYDRSLAIWERIGDKQGLTSTLNNIGELHLLKGETAKALEVYTRNLEIREKANDKLGCALTLCGLGQTYLQIGEPAIALEKSGMAIDIARQTNSKSIEGRGLWVMGIICREMGNLDEAGKNLDRSIELLEEGKNNREAAYAHYDYGLLLMAMHNPDSARLHIEKGLGLFRSMGMKLWIKKAEAVIASL